MKVLMTADTVGGVWTYALELAGALRRTGGRVVLATMGPPPDAAQRRDAREAGLELHESAYHLEWMDEPWEDVGRAGRWLLDLERDVEPDVVHLNGYAHASLPWRAPVMVVAHSCVCSWWRAVHGCDPPGDTWARYREATGRGLAAAEVVVAPTRAMLDALAACYDAPRRGEVICNGRDAARFQPGPKRPLVFAAGRVWDEAKNMRALEAVAGRLDWPVCIAGDQRHPVTGELPAMSVEQLGRLTPAEVARQLAAASIYALPARYEPFGLGALEAALAGCALVLGNIASLREVWADAALYVNPDEPEALGDALTALIREPARRRTLAQAARRRALTMTPARMADGYDRLYRDLASRRCGPAAARRPSAVTRS
ncbi:MAG: glycosyltransferase family 4 protein [Phycisphaeraceae bacterium]